MTDLALFELEPDWVPVTRRGVDLVSMVASFDARCRDCGRKGGARTCGGADARGIWDLCDECASLDGCLTRESLRGPDFHCSLWGIVHAAAEHDDLVARQSKRRAAYVRRGAS